MRASPAFQVSLHRFGVWRGGVLLLAVAGLSGLAAWGVARERSMGAAAWIAMAAAGLTIGWLAWSLARVPVSSLRWDGQLWHLGRPGSLPDESVPGDLVVTIDLGRWMLLRFEPAVSQDRRRRVTWLPAQRRGAEAQWHALRCAVYAPRPSPGADAAAGR